MKAAPAASIAALADLATRLAGALREGPHEFQNLRYRLALCDPVDNGGPDDHPVGNACYRGSCFGRAHAKADADRQISCVLDPGDLRPDLLGRCGRCAGRPGDRYIIDEAGGVLEN